jgi:Tfp pilus assembly protein FimT
MARHGSSLIEIAVVLGVMTVALGIAVPAFRHALDAYGAAAGRDAVVAMAARARAVAIAHGGADLIIDADSGWARIEAPGAAPDMIAIRDRYGVAFAIENSSRTAVTIHYDGIGLGRLANLSLLVRKGDARARVVFSMYGRARRG